MYHAYHYRRLLGRWKNDIVLWSSQFTLFLVNSQQRTSISKLEFNVTVYPTQYTFTAEHLSSEALILSILPNTYLIFIKFINIYYCSSIFA